MIFNFENACFASSIAGIFVSFVVGIIAIAAEKNKLAIAAGVALMIFAFGLGGLVNG